MRSTFHGIETAKRSLFTQQAALNTTGHNIANANTAGYSRQVVNMTASIPVEAFGLNRSNAPGQLGTGVEFTSITRMREKFLDDQFRNENKSFGNWTVQQDTLEKLEKIVNEPSDTGIRTVLDNFWKSWSDLSKDPENITGRKIVRENAKALADAFNLTSKQLSDLSADLTDNLNVKATDINTKLQQIGDLNLEIRKIEGLGDNANDLRDQRDLMTDQLSKIINIQVVEQSDGYTISMGGTQLLTGATSTAVSAASLQTAFTSGGLSSGEAYGIIVARDTYVKDYQNQLDTLANAIANGDIEVTIPEGSVLPDQTTLDVIQPNGTKQTTTFSGATRTVPAGGIKVVVHGLNGLHQLGYNFNSPLEAGAAFFTAASGNSITAASMKLNPLIDGDPSRIATSMRTVLNSNTGKEEPVKGNNSLALLVSKLKDVAFDYSSSSTAALLQKGTLNDFIRSTTAQLGVQTSEAIRQVGNQKALVDQIDSRRMSVSGVSNDEEMSNMIKFQHAYNAAARVMTTMDEVLDKLINSTGVVGR